MSKATSDSKSKSDSKSETSKKDAAKTVSLPVDKNVTSKTSKDVVDDTTVTTPVKKGEVNPELPETDKEVTQGTPGEQRAPSMPDPEIKKVSREDKSKILDLHDNTKEQEKYEQKPAAEIADIKTAVDADLEKNEVVSEGSVPERSDENVHIITSEIDGKEQVVGVESRDEQHNKELQAQAAVNAGNAAAADEPTPIEKTIQKLNEQKPEENKIDPKDKDAQMDEKILKHLKAGNDYVKINPFLKSLYPARKGNEPNAWDQQGEAKRMRVLLDTMQSHGLIDIQSNSHGKLGTTWYTPTEQFARTHTLDTVDIYARRKG